MSCINSFAHLAMPCHAMADADTMLFLIMYPHIRKNKNVHSLQASIEVVRASKVGDLSAFVKILL